MADVNETLAERGSRYGDFATHAKITQGLKDVMIASPKWKSLTASMKEALDMVMHKVGRILNGDPTYADSWHDIAGYSTLVEQELAEAPAPTYTPPAPTTVADIEHELTPTPAATAAVARVNAAANLPPPVVGSPSLDKALEKAASAPLPPLSVAPSAPVAPVTLPPKVPSK